MARIALKGSANAKVATYPATLSIRMHFSHQHLWSAQQLTQSAKRIEKNNSELKSHVRTKYLAAVTSSVILSVASIESAIHDVWADAFDALEGNLRHFQGLDPALPRRLCDLWPHVNRLPLMVKASIVLATVGAEPYNTKRDPYRRTDKLIRLRNALVHYFPEWDTNQKKHKAITDAFKDSPFPPSPFVAPGDAWFPTKCLGYGCAAWSVNTAAVFINDFLTRIGVPSWVPKKLFHSGKAR
jgi:hypothetical protein